MFVNSLSGRFLLLTILFVMLAEILIFVPVISRFRYDTLHESLVRSQIASLTLLASPNNMVDAALEAELLDNAGVLSVALSRDSIRQLMLKIPNLGAVDYTVDLRKSGTLYLMWEALETFLSRSERIIRVIAEPVKGGGDVIEFVILEKSLREAMISYGYNILHLSIFISLLTAWLLFWAAQLLIVRPISRVVKHMRDFKKMPENTQNIIHPRPGITELYQAEVALQDMQTQLNQSLRHKERLAALGRAISKISHDLRNILTTTQLLADRVESSKDPHVQRIAPKLMQTLSRAVNLCEHTLRYGRAEETAPQYSQFLLKKMVNNIIESEYLTIGAAPIKITHNIVDSIKVHADEEQLYRVISNLIRNARQVLQTQDAGGLISISVNKDVKYYFIDVCDTGSGLPNRALDNLFKPFEGGVRAGGFGLGLAISEELIKGHGGTLRLLKTNKNGTCFRVTLPKLQ